MTEGYKTQFGWNTLPDRDMALELVYDFIRSIGTKNIDKAKSLIVVKDINFFLLSLHQSLIKYLEMVLEDEEWENYATKNLALEIDDPELHDEQLSLPEFSGKEIILKIGETVSIQIGLHDTITPIRLHFVVTEADAIYFLKLQRITAE